MSERAARDRSAQAGLVLAAAVHLALLAALSLGRGVPPVPPPDPAPLEVSLVTAVAPEAQAPPAPEPPAPSVAPDTGPPEDAAPPPAPVAKPAPVRPTPAPPTKAPPAKPAPAKPAPDPAPVTRPQPVAAVKPAPTKPVVAARPAPARPAAAPRPSRLAGLQLGTGEGANPASSAARPRGRRLGSDFLAGLAPDAPSRTPSTAAPAAKAGPYPTASIVGAIARQIQPCADRQVNPGAGANRIVTTLNIRLNPDGTLAATPTRVRQAGVSDENERYAQRVVDLGIAAFKGCSPLRLPAEYYQTASGGWNNINYQWQLR